MEGREFANGDKVRDYHGRVMIIEAVYPRPRTYRYRCVWQAQNGDTKRDVFKVGELTLDWESPQDSQ